MLGATSNCAGAVARAERDFGISEKDAKAAAAVRLRLIKERHASGRRGELRREGGRAVARGNRLEGSSEGRQPMLLVVEVRFKFADGLVELRHLVWTLVRRCPPTWIRGRF